MANKKELAKLAVNLFDNIDQADQFDVYELFEHLDKAFLLKLIEDFYNAILQNKELGRTFYTMSEDEVEEVLAKARKILKIEEDNYEDKIAKQEEDIEKLQVLKKKTERFLSEVGLSDEFCEFIGSKSVKKELGKKRKELEDKKEKLVHLKQEQKGKKREQEI